MKYKTIYKTKEVDVPTCLGWNKDVKQALVNVLRDSKERYEIYVETDNLDLSIGDVPTARRVGNKKSYKTC